MVLVVTPQRLTLTVVEIDLMFTLMTINATAEDRITTISIKSKLDLSSVRLGGGLLHWYVSSAVTSSGGCALVLLSMIAQINLL